MVTFRCLQEKWKKKAEVLDHLLENVKSICPSFLNDLKLQLRSEMASTRCYNCHGHDFTHCEFKRVLAAAASCLTHRYPRGDTKPTSDLGFIAYRDPVHFKVTLVSSKVPKVTLPDSIWPRHVPWTHWKRLYETVCTLFPQWRHLWWVYFFSLLSQRPREMDFQHSESSLQTKRSNSHEPWRTPGGI